MQSLLDALTNWGLVGLLIVMVIEGSSLPFPGIIVVLTYGYLLRPTVPKLFGLALIMSAAYSLSSYIPYGIGLKLGALFPKRFKRKLRKAQHTFQRYGLWSIALSRPLGIGNYISYVAGMCKVKLLPYGVLTFLGILPWAVIVLFLGRLVKGNGERAANYLYEYQWYVYAILITITLAYVAARYCKRNRQKMSER